LAASAGQHGDSNPPLVAADAASPPGQPRDERYLDDCDFASAYGRVCQGREHPPAERGIALRHELLRRADPDLPIDWRLDSRSHAQRNARAVYLLP
jgi:hypothetical protein